MEPRFFLTATRQFLGLPVTADTCYICESPQSMVPNGEHSHHTRGRINKRHTLVKDVTYDIVKHARTATDNQYGVEAEQRLEDLGFTRVSADEGRDIADIVLLSTTGPATCVVIDIAVVHPRFDTPGDWVPGAKAEREALDKWKKYSVWNIPRADVIPLVLDTYGGINKAGLEFINYASALIACGNADRLQEIRRCFRESLAVARVRGQGRLVEAWNRMNRFKSGPGVGGQYLSI